MTRRVYVPTPWQAVEIALSQGALDAWGAGPHAECLPADCDFAMAYSKAHMEHMFTGFIAKLDVEDNEPDPIWHKKEQQ